MLQEIDCLTAELEQVTKRDLNRMKTLFSEWKFLSLLCGSLYIYKTQLFFLLQAKSVLKVKQWRVCDACYDRVNGEGAPCYSPQPIVTSPSPPPSTSRAAPAEGSSTCTIPSTVSYSPTSPTSSPSTARATRANEQGENPERLPTVRLHLDETTGVFV